jgi:APA family basic amino acid/polyamine antiporter
MYSYSGWNAATYIGGELRDPARNLPRALFAGTAIVIALYVLLNAVFLVTTPMHELAGQLDVAIVAGKHVFGESRRAHRRRADLPRARYRPSAP